MAKNALIIGSTGLIGSDLLQMLLQDANYDSIIAITRREINVTNHKLKQIIADLDDVSEKIAGLAVDDVFCCLGTTMKQAGSKQQFRRIDYEYPLKVADLTKQNGASQYLLISALGADKKSAVYYNQVKGEVEEAIREVGFKSYHIFRPSLLLGPRAESRVGENAAKTLFSVFGFLLVGPLKKYRAIESSKVASAMQTIAQREEEGMHIHESIELQYL